MFPHYTTEAGGDISAENMQVLALRVKSHCGVLLDGKRDILRWFSLRLQCIWRLSRVAQLVELFPLDRRKLYRLQRQMGVVLVPALLLRAQL